MWFHGIKDIPRYELHRLKQVRKKASWDKPVVPPGPPLVVDPLRFIYASTRSSILGQKIGLRGQLAGQGLGAAALCYLTPNFHSASVKPINNIFLHHNFYHAKDFIGSSIKGTIGASLAYLEMQDLGYAWCGHWEDCTSPGVSTTSTSASAPKASGSAPAKAPAPDFVFASSSNICLVDAKGSARTMKEVRLIAKNEWKRQIYSNRLVKLAGGGMATEGRIIAASLANPNGVGLVTAHGRFPGSTLPPGTGGSTRVSTTSKAIKAVQKINFTNAFYLLGLNSMASHFIGGPLGLARAEMDDARLSAVDIDDFGAVYAGGRRIVDLGGQGAWTMQPFCRLDVLEEAFENLLTDNAPAVAETPPILNQSPDNATSSGDGKMTSSDQVILQSRDGVGAIFKRVAYT
ncbi:hypothetical protein PHLH6_28240 [Pseudomonas sp. Seg1]|uniref:hypothetical protein n=1 Tax=Pseudomonas sp. Seg1 TaxID=2678259 RepID=UPI001BB445D3|nr:hypothetical protein [Pseudomonas sp. Seg1]BBP70820.1 hypothetical protein PHLH6_28240 [Pseudomonas sp. Seg1]